MNTLSYSYRRTLIPDEDNISDKPLIIKSPTTTSSPSFTTTSPFDSSLVLTILILLTVLFFIAFFSLFLRRFTLAESQNSLSNHHRPSPPRKRHHGVDPTTVLSLPTLPYANDMKILNECSICLSEFEDKEIVKVIPYCGHGFHPMCIEMWLSSHVSCPLCRSTRLFPDNVSDDVLEDARVVRGETT